MFSLFKKKEKFLKPVGELNVPDEIINKIYYDDPQVEQGLNLMWSSYAKLIHTMRRPYSDEELEAMFSLFARHLQIFAENHIDTMFFTVFTPLREKWARSIVIKDGELDLKEEIYKETIKMTGYLFYLFDYAFVSSAMFHAYVIGLLEDGVLIKHSFKLYLQGEQILRAMKLKEHPLLEHWKLIYLMLSDVYTLFMLHSVEDLIKNYELHLLPKEVIMIYWSYLQSLKEFLYQIDEVK